LKGEQRRKVTQYHYTVWPDAQTPGDVFDLLEFVQYVRFSVDEEAAGPLVVHCRLGIRSSSAYDLHT
jgi:protein tyrosine phosphatase